MIVSKAVAEKIRDAGQVLRTMIKEAKCREVACALVGGPGRVQIPEYAMHMLGFRICSQNFKPY